MILGWELFWIKKHRDSLVEFLTELYSCKQSITGRNIAKLSRGHYMQKYFKVVRRWDLLKILQTKILKFFEKAEFMNQNCRGKYCAFMKRRNL